MGREFGGRSQSHQKSHEYQLANLNLSIGKHDAFCASANSRSKREFDCGKYAEFHMSDDKCIELVTTKGFPIILLSGKMAGCLTHIDADLSSRPPLFNFVGAERSVRGRNIIFKFAGLVRLLCGPEPEVQYMVCWTVCDLMNEYEKSIGYGC